MQVVKYDIYEPDMSDMPAGGNLVFSCRLSGARMNLQEMARYREIYREAIEISITMFGRTFAGRCNQIFSKFLFFSGCPSMQCEMQVAQLPKVCPF